MSGLDLRGPDFFIVGAPKCGTTAMASYLAQHPEVGMSERKEPNYFVGDLGSKMAVRRGHRPLTEEQYLAFFATVQDRQRLGEASVWYLYSTDSPTAIGQYRPDADIVVMLRNPVEMLPSLHSQFVYIGVEPIEDFGQALALDEQRERNGTPQGFPPRSYRSAVAYAEQVKRYLDVFGRDRVHAVVYDDFRADTRSAYRTTCEFLRVDPGFEPEIAVVNPNKRVRSRAVRRLVRRPPERLRRVLHPVTSPATRRRVFERLKRWNTNVGPRQPATGATAEVLRSLAAEQAAELRALLGLDLDVWLTSLSTASRAPDREP